MKIRVAIGLVAVLSISSFVASAEPPNALLSLDSLSFVANALDDGEQIPITAIPVRIESQSGSTWAIFIEPGDVDLPPIRLDNGERVRWTLIERAAGSATLSNGVTDVTLSARFLVKSLDSTRQAEHTLSFTTRATETERSDLEVSREGVPLDRRSGYVQLVASASDPPKSDHGIPFFVVLSGRFTAAPTGFLSAQ